MAALLNCLLCCLVWIPGIIHAILIVNESKNDKRTDRIINAMEKQGHQQARMAAAQQQLHR